MDLGLSGLASGFDWRSLIDQLMEVERAPGQRMRADQTAIQQRNQACASVVTQLQVLQNRVTTLSDPGLFDSRVSTTSDETIGTAEASAGAVPGSYSFNILQLAQAARHWGAGNAAIPLSATNDVSDVMLNDTAFGEVVRAGTLTVNGKQLTVAATDSLQTLFDKISAATSGAVSASYDAATDRIRLTGTGPIVLGSATDTSNFLDVARLYNNGTGEIVSSGALGRANLRGSIPESNLATPITDGGSGAGEFRINGVSVAFNASADSIQAILDRINHSAAGVTASYDRLNDRFVLANKTAGDVGIALEDVTGNFLTATGLQSGTLERGKDLLYTVDNGEVQIARSNTITDASSGLAGLAVTAAKEGTVLITVSNDTAAMKTAIKDFISDYNKAQGLIETLTASSTDADGKVTAGTLSGDSDAYGISSRLRSLINATISSLPGGLRCLEDLGITSNGNDNNLALSDETKLDAALSGRLDVVKTLFADEASGVAVQLNAYLEKTSGEDGALGVKQDNLTKESARIDVQVADLERRLEAERQQLIERFIVMETAQANINRQLQFLAQGLAGMQAP